jgi:hypothetical protein
LIISLLKNNDKRYEKTGSKATERLPEQ